MVTPPDGSDAPVQPGTPGTPVGHRAIRRAVDWAFVDRRSGGYTVAQFPNLPLGAFLVLTVVRLAARPAGTAGTALHVAADVSLAVWAIDELLRGVNPFRRLLGLVVVAATLVDLVRSA